MIDRNKLIKLSYDMDPTAPVPTGIPKAEICNCFTIKNEGSNVFNLSFSSHTGSHLDAANHMISKGKKITDFTIADFIFDAPCLVEIPLEGDELICTKHFKPYLERIETCDFLLIATGWAPKRKKEPGRYAQHCPGLSAEAAECLAQFQNIRAIGADILSFAAPAHVKEGIEAHKILWRSNPRIQLYEDLDIRMNAKEVKQIVCAPWIVRGADSAPCTLIGLLG